MRAMRITANGGLVVAAVVLPLAVSVSCAGQPSSAGSTAELQKFWTEFRAAALEGNMDKVASLTQFPFTVRGVLDSDPVQALDHAAFLPMFAKLLAQDPGLKAEPETMRDLIERTKALSDKALGDGGRTARLGTFVFARTGGQWRFTRAYVEE